MYMCFFKHSSTTIILFYFLIGGTRSLSLYSSVLCSVADPVFFGHPDPDPDPGKYRIRIWILYPQKDPMLFKFSRYKIV